MSLDVWLIDENAQVPVGSGIFIREDGQTKEITREEWDRRNPDREPVVFEHEPEQHRRDVYAGNVTHNLNTMANAVSERFYLALWHPDRLSATKASDISPILAEGLDVLKASPEKFRAMNPQNGWGSYEVLMEFVTGYLGACMRYPNAVIHTWG